MYTSDRNTQWLDIPELRELLATVPHTTTAVPAPVGMSLTSPPAIAGGTPIREQPLPYGRHQLDDA